MTLPAFIPSVDQSVQAIILQKLQQIERDFAVRILFAIESGSRAWGFPSPDSDFDVRFVYAHEPDWYLSLRPGRDVIERPIEGDWDINGWDIRKALNLLLKPNPVLLEWLSSPIRYMWAEPACDALTALSVRTAFGAACVHHYRNLAQGQWDKHVGETAQVNYKKYFYILRPALSIHWVRANSGTTPPMNLQALVGGLPLAPEMVHEIARLVRLKADAKEIGTGPRVARIDAYISEQIAWAQRVEKSDTDPALAEEANALFQRIVKGGLQ